MTDIPNYLSLILSVVISIVIVVYQKSILDYFSRRNENKLVKRKDKAFSLYRETQRLQSDQSYLLIKFAKMQLQIAISAVSAIASMCTSIYISSLDSLHAVCKIGKSVNVNCNELFQTEFSKTLLSIIPIFDSKYFGFMHFVMLTIISIMVQFSFAMFLIACIELFNTVRRLEHFEEFELRLKRQWPDAFVSAASVEARNESSAPSLSEICARH